VNEFSVTNGMPDVVKIVEMHLSQSTRPEGVDPDEIDK